MFVRLGFPKETYMIDYLSGLFLSAGIKLGISLWFLRVISRALLHMWAQGSFCASHYHFRDMDLQSGHVEPSTKPWPIQSDSAFRPQINHTHMNSPNLNADSFYRDDSFCKLNRQRSPLERKTKFERRKSQPSLR
jgi:hypothetical protein